MVASHTHKTTSPSISSVVHPSSISHRSKNSSSSILKSSFSPSRFQLNLFASVIRGLDNEHLRIHDTSSGLLKNDYSLKANASITCLQWGRCPNEEDNHSTSNSRKRKRSKPIADPVLAFGTSLSEINFYSPQEAKVVGTLKNGHAQGIKDFKFDDDGLKGQAWSVGGDSKLVQWNLAKRISVRSIALSSALVNTIEISASSLLYASHVAYLQDIAFSEPPVTFNASTNSVRFILSQPTHDVSRKSFITAARNDRHLTVFRKGLSSLVGTLRTEGEVMSMDLSSSAPSSPSQSTAHGYPNESKEILVIVNQDGGLEIFPKPFDFAEHTQQNGLSSTKDRMKGRSRRSATQVNLKASGKDPHFVPIISVSIQGCYLLAAWVVAGVNLRFERIKWQDEATGELVLHGAVEVPCEPGETFEVEGSANETRKMGKNRLNESNAVVMNGSGNTDTVQEDKAPIVIDISSAEENSSSDAETEDSAPVQSTTATSIPERFDSDAVTPGKRDLESTASIQQAGQVLSSQAEPTFAELLRAGAPKPIDLSESHQDLLEAGRPANSDITLQQTAPGLSLSTVLSQSLKTNDKRLLQSCLQNRDLATVRTTIERLNPELAPGLMQKLAQLLHSRPGRAGSLLVWVQWTLIAHGGSLAGRADVMKDLRSLHDVVKQRANSLQSLLTLKGKLDMLEAQMNIRNRLKKNSKRIEDTDEGAILYVEGQSEEDSDFDGGSNDDSSAADDAHIQNAIGAQTRVLEGVHDKNADSSDRLLTTDSGFMASEDTESEEGISANEGLSTEDESEDESSSGEVDYDDVDTISTDGAASPLTNGINDVD